MDTRVWQSFRKALVMVSFVVFSIGGGAQITLPRFFSDHMVLKRDSETAFWGWSQPGRTVYIKASWLPDTLKTVALGTSKWRVDLPTTKAGGPYNIVIISEKDTVKISERNLCLHQCEGRFL